LAIPSAEWLSRQGGETTKRVRPCLVRTKSDNDCDNHRSALNEQDTCSIEAEDLKKVLLANLRRRRMIVGEPIGGARLEEIYDAVAEERDPWPSGAADSQEAANVLRFEEPQPPDSEGPPPAVLGAEGAGVEGLQMNLNKQGGKLMPALALVKASTSGAGSPIVSGAAQMLNLPEVASTPGQSSGSQSHRKSSKSSLPGSPVDPDLQADHRAAWRPSAQGKNLGVSFVKKPALFEVQGTSSPSTGTSTTGPTSSGPTTVTRVDPPVGSQSLDSVEEATESEAGPPSASSSAAGTVAWASPASLVRLPNTAGWEDGSAAVSASSDEPEGPAPAAAPPRADSGGGSARSSLRQSLAGLPLEATLQDILLHDSRIGDLSLQEFLGLLNQCKWNPIIEEDGKGDDEQAIVQDVPGIPGGCGECETNHDGFSLLDLDENFLQELKMLVLLHNGLNVRGCKCKPGGPHTCMTPASKLVSYLASHANSLSHSAAQTCQPSNEASRRESLSNRRHKEPGSVEQAASSSSAQRTTPLGVCKIGSEMSNKSSLVAISRTSSGKSSMGGLFIRRMSSSASNAGPVTIPEAGDADADKCRAGLQQHRGGDCW